MIIERADVALYGAKQRGRNCVRLQRLTGDLEIAEPSRKPMLDEQEPATSQQNKHRGVERVYEANVFDPFHNHLPNRVRHFTNQSPPGGSIF